MVRIRKKSKHFKGGNPHPPKASQFKPGNKLGGRKKDSPEVLTLKQFTREVVAQYITELLQLSREGLYEFMHDRSQPGLKSAIAYAIYWREWDTIDNILDRCIGKVPQRVEGEGFSSQHYLLLSQIQDEKKDPEERLKAFANRLSEKSAR